MRDLFLIDTVAEILGLAVSRHGSVRDDAGQWIAAAHDTLGELFEVAAGLHMEDARDAARDLMDGLAARGFAVQRQPSAEGNGLSARLVRLSAELAAAAGDPARVAAVAGVLGALAAEARDRDDAAVPPHLWLEPDDMPAGVVRLCDHRRRA